MLTKISIADDLIEYAQQTARDKYEYIEMVEDALKVERLFETLGTFKPQPGEFAEHLDAARLAERLEGRGEVATIAEATDAGLFEERETVMLDVGREGLELFELGSGSSYAEVVDKCGPLPGEMPVVVGGGVIIIIVIGGGRLPGVDPRVVEVTEIQEVEFHGAELEVVASKLEDFHVPDAGLAHLDADGIDVGAIGSDHFDFGPG